MKPNIFFIVIDSFRADKFYGKNKTSITPNIDSLIQNGVYFEQAISSVGSTGSSLASMFTGLFPFKTGMSSDNFKKLDSSIQSYIHLLKKNGYHTYAASPPITSSFGLTNDFKKSNQVYDNYVSIFSGMGEEIVESIKNNNMEKPWFFYYHIYDLHQPIILPNEFDNEKFGNSRYERMISAIDSWIGNFIKNLDMSITLIIITADHGDYIPVLSKHNLNFESSDTEQTLWKLGNRVPKSLRPIKVFAAGVLRNARNQNKTKKINDLSLSPYEKRQISSSRMGEGHQLFDDILRVPLLFSGFNVKNKIVSEQVRLVDVFPTLFRLLGMEDSIKNIHGKNLFPLIQDKNEEELVTYIESPPAISKSEEKMIGVRTSSFKYIRNISNKDQIELYDLKNDPLEENNIAEQETDTVKKLEELLSNLKNYEYDKETNSEDSTDREAIEAELRKLGYI